MKVELTNAYVEMRVNGELCRIAAEAAVVYLNEDGTIFQFEAKFMLGTPVDAVLRIGNRTRMRVSFNGRGLHSFIHSEPGQDIVIIRVEYTSTTERV